MSAFIEKVYEPSHIRRGRASTTPTWYVHTDDGARWRFTRKLDARRFINKGCVCDPHDDRLWRCANCFGWNDTALTRTALTTKSKRKTSDCERGSTRREAVEGRPNNRHAPGRGSEEPGTIKCELRIGPPLKFKAGPDDFHLDDDEDEDASPRTANVPGVEGER